MSPEDQYHELLIAIIIGIIVLLVIASTVVFILLFYQKKKFFHKRQLSDMEHHFAEELFKAQLEIQEQTFNQISAEIHDNVGQVLSLAKVQVNILLQKQEIDNEMLNDVKDHIGKTIIDLRNIAKSLNNNIINSSSIQEAIDAEAVRINKTAIFNVAVEVLGEQKEMHNQKKLILYRIIQECLQNILKHAGAKKVLICFRYEPDSLYTTIADDGIGFDVNTVLQQKAGLGLFNIETRARLAAGKCFIDSSVGKGSNIKIEMPYV